MNKSKAVLTAEGKVSAKYSMLNTWLDNYFPALFTSSCIIKATFNTRQDTNTVH